MHITHTSERGFTLILISILLTVVALALVVMLPSTRTRPDKDSATQTRLNEVLTSLREYQAANGDLPCPADASQPIGSVSYGVAAANAGTTGNCTGGSPSANYADSTNHVAIGMVPVRALGLPNSDALDAYGRDITYAVDTNATVCGWPSPSLTGQITVTDNGIAYNTIAALVSHGMDGHGAWIPLPGSTGTAVRLNAGSTDPDELTNAHVNSSFNPTMPLTNFVKKQPTPTFDDLVVYKSPLWTLNSLPKSAPVITAITPPANGVYSTGQVLTFTVTYSTAVAVNTTGGTPYLSLSAITGSIGSGNVAKATYQSGSGTATLTFSYTVAPGDYASSGLTITSPINLNGGTIMAGSACAATYFTPSNFTGVIVGPYVYVADCANNRVQVFNSSGSFLFGIGAGYQGVSGSVGSSGTGNGQFYCPEAIAVDSSGNIWVADWYNNRVEKFNSSGSFLLGIGAGYDGVGGSVGSSGSGNGQFNQPADLALDTSGNVWVADNANNRIQEFNSSGSYLSKFGSSGSGTGHFNYPFGIAIDGSGNLWIMDKCNFRLQKCTTGGSCTAYGSQGSGNGQFSANYCAIASDMVSIDGSGNVWATDEPDARVEEFSSSGSYLGQIASLPSGGAGPNLGSGTGTAFDSSGNIWIANENSTSGEIVQKYQTNGTLLGTALGTAGTAGTASGLFYYPQGVFINSR